MEGLMDWGIRLIQILQQASPALDAPMEFFTFLGTIEFYLLLLPFVYWNLHTRIGFRLLLVLIGTDAISTGFKHLLRQPRPYWVGGVAAKASELSYGIPSSHASDSLAVWGYLSRSYRRFWLRVVAAVLIIFIAFSRLYLGVHFPHDIAGGWLIGLLILFFFPAAEKWLKGRLGTAPLVTQTLAALAGSAIIAAIGLSVNTATGTLVDPPAWSALSSEARDLAHYFTLAGASFGAITGYAVLVRTMSYKAGGPWHLRILRYALGIIGVFLIWQGLDVVFGPLAPEQSALGYLLRFIRYGATTLWAMLGAPFVFLRLRLAADGQEQHPPWAASARPESG